MPHCKCKSHSPNANRHIDPTVLHMCANTQPTSINTSHVIAKYVLETNIPIKLDI